MHPMSQDYLLGFDYLVSNDGIFYIPIGLYFISIYFYGLYSSQYPFCLDGYFVYSQANGSCLSYFEQSFTSLDRLSIQANFVLSPGYYFPA